MISFPFDSQITGTDAAGMPIYDRASSSDELARLLHSFFTNGIFDGSGFAVTVSGLTASVSPGSCLINGRYGYEPETRVFALESGGSLPRIDTIVLRLDLTLNKRSIDLYLRKGKELSTPEPLAMERNESMWELGIANIYVAAGATSVNQSTVTDTRLYTVRCGLVTQAMKTIDTTTFYNQIAADLAAFRAEEEAGFSEWSENRQTAFDAWFADLQATLDGDTAGNLYNLINARLPLAGGTMTGPVNFAAGDSTYGGSVGIGNSTGNVYMAHQTNGVQDNYLVLTGEESRVGIPWGVKYGGTGADTPKGARRAIGAPGIAVKSITLPANWKGNAAVVAWSAVESGSSVVILIPDSNSYDHFMDCRVRVAEIGAGTLTIVATTNPTQQMTITMVALDYLPFIDIGVQGDATTKTE